MEHRDSLDALVVVGGDGMAHLGAQVCAEHRLPLGIMAAGSGDDVASSLRLPRHDPPEPPPCRDPQELPSPPEWLPEHLEP